MNMDEQVEASILQNFLLMQADKHGHHLLAGLPAIAGDPLKKEVVPEPETVKDDSDGNSNMSTETSNMSSDDPPSLVSSDGPPTLVFQQPNTALMLQQLQKIHQLQQLQQLQNQQRQLGLEQQRQRQLGLVTLERIGTAVSVIQKREEKSKFVILPQTPHASIKQELCHPLDEGGACRPLAEGGASPTPLLPVDRPIQKRERNRNRVENLLCCVCGEKAGKHSYYGGQVCPSCRAFFRRSVQSGCHEGFKCINRNETCTINLLTRKNCQFCRFSKCLEGGMRPSWILSEEERIRRFHGRARGKGAKEQNAKPVDQSPNPVRPPSNQSSPPPSPQETPPSASNLAGPGDLSRSSDAGGLSPEETQGLLQYVEIILKCCTGRHDDFEPILLTDLVQTTLHGSNLSRHTAERISTILDTRTRVSFSLLQEFQSLSEGDQTSLLRHNLPLLHRFRQSVCLADPQLSFRSLVGVLVGEEKLVDAERHIPFDLSRNNNTPTGVRLDYRSLVACPEGEQEVTHARLVTQIAQIVDPSDTISLVLLVLIIAFSPDFIDLENRKQVEKIQLKFVILLQKHKSAIPNQTQPLDLANTTGRAAFKEEKRSSCTLINLLMVPAMLRQILEITKERLLL